MASTTTKLSNIINPEVMSDMIEAKIEQQVTQSQFLLGITLVMLKTLMLKKHLTQMLKLKQQI